MIKRLLLVMTLATSSLFSLEKLPSEYLVTFGDPNTQVEFTQYFSLSCAHCVQIFRNDFGKIQEEYIENGQLRYVFHPVPMDLTTVQFMCCLEKLDQNEKRLLLTVLLEELSLDNPEFNVLLMKKAMEIFKKNLDEIEDETFIKLSGGFNAARDFITQEESVMVVPSLQIGEKMIEKEPDYNFISLIMNKLFIKESDYEF